MTIGSTLDTDRNTVYMKEIFRLLERHANNKGINSRMRFMIRDLDELRVRPGLVPPFVFLFYEALTPPLSFGLVYRMISIVLLVGRVQYAMSVLHSGVNSSQKKCLHTLFVRVTCVVPQYPGPTSSDGAFVPSVQCSALPFGMFSVVNVSFRSVL